MENRIDGARLSRARRALRVQFMALGVLAGAWAVHVPSAKHHHQLSAGGLSLALLAWALGSVLALTQASRLVQGWGPRRLAGVAFPLACIALSLVLWPGLAVPAGQSPSALHLAGLWALMLLGGMGGALFDVAVNTEASRLETLSGRPVMSGFHGMWSLGGMAGAAVASGLLRAEVPPSWQLPLMMGVAWAASQLTRGALLPSAPPAATPAPSADDEAGGAGAGATGGTARPVWRHPQLLLLGALGVCGLLAEGAVYDWIVLWLQQDLRLSPAVAALGYGGFAAAMAATRFAGDALRQRLSPRQLLLISGGLPAVALAAALATHQPAVAFPALVLAGIGMANLVPVIMMAASHVAGIAPAAGIATVSALGYTAFVAGPPLIGSLADAVSLTAALWVAVGMLVLQTLGALRVPQLAPGPVVAVGPARQAAG